jgi:hypothetical protein
VSDPVRVVAGPSRFLSRGSFEERLWQIVICMTTEWPLPDDGALSAAIVPDGWELLARDDGTRGTVLRYGRPREGRGGQHWIMASGATHDEAVTAACLRMRLFDEAGREP